MRHVLVIDVETDPVQGVDPVEALGAVEDAINALNLRGVNRVLVEELYNVNGQFESGVDPAVTERVYP